MVEEDGKQRVECHAVHRQRAIRQQHEGRLHIEHLLPARFLGCLLFRLFPTGRLRRWASLGIMFMFAKSVVSEQVGGLVVA